MEAAKRVEGVRAEKAAAAEAQRLADIAAREAAELAELEAKKQAALAAAAEQVVWLCCFLSVFFPGILLHRFCVCGLSSAFWT